MTQSTAESDHPTILVVDDSPAALYVKSRLLNRQRRYRIIEADNGADALTVATAERPALILLDVNLSDVSGFEVCQQLKTQPETKVIKILQTSAALGPSVGETETTIYGAGPGWFIDQLRSALADAGIPPVQARFLAV